MLSTSSKKLLGLANKQTKNITSFRQAVFDVLNRDDPSCEHFQAQKYSPLLPLKGHNTQAVQDATLNYEITTLSNGVRVLTESQGIPSVVDMGVLLNVGARDENNETSGSLLSMKNTYMKTVLNTNETVNYGMVQMSGGQFEMEYDQETTYYRANCLSHDVVDIFNMVSDCALEPRSVVAASVGQEKNAGTHKLANVTQSGEEFNNNVFQTAFGLRGLGMPLNGLQGNVNNLSAYTLQKFQLDNINPSKVIVCGAGIQNHQEFVDLVKSRLESIPAVSGNSSRAKTQYVGGETRDLTDSSVVNMALLFESVPWTHADFYALKVAQALLGCSSLGNNSRVNRNLVNKHHFVDSARAVNNTFSDSGLFGLQVSGSASNGNQILEAALNELKGLTKVTANELTAAQSLVKNQVSVAMERQTDRLEEATKNLNFFGKVVYNDYCANIDKVTAQSVGKAVSNLLSKRPTFVSHGGDVNTLMSYDKLVNATKL